MATRTFVAMVALCTVAASMANATGFGFRRGTCGDGTLTGGFFRRLEVVGLTDDQRLVCFEEQNPGLARTIDRISGLGGSDTKLIGIDFRPATRELYGVGNGGGIYTIDVRTATATFKSQLNTTLLGTSFGVDFNPTVDRLRLISDTKQNLRINVDTGVATVDPDLNYPPPSPPPGTGVTGAAYTNNDTDPNTGTTLYDIDITLDQLVSQAPPNAGTLNFTGKLTVDTGSAVGFDIYSTVSKGTTTQVKGFASLVTGGLPRFYLINLFTGQATLRGTFSTFDPVVDIALPPSQF